MRDTPETISKLLPMGGQSTLTFGAFVGVDCPDQNAFGCGVRYICQYAEDVHADHLDLGSA